MADRVDFYFRQKVTEAELDLAFELLEKADRNLAADLGVYGIISGAVPTPHAPVPDLAETIIDRVLERGRIVMLDGPSMRNPEGLTPPES